MKKKDTPLYVRLISYQKKWLASRSKATNLPESHIIRDLIDQAIQANSK